MNSDSAFILGATHTACQDYAIAGNSNVRKFPYVILSDGCSTSPDTDIGARLTAKAAEQILNSCDSWPPVALHESAAQLALSWAKLIGLPPEAVDATLLTAFVVDTELIVCCSGDGLIVVETLAGTLDVYSISYPAGYPFYPTYLYQTDRLEALLASDRIVKEVRHFHSPSINEPLQLASIDTGNSMTQLLSFGVAGYKWAALISDGIHSFFRNDPAAWGKRMEPILMTEVLGELLSFKSWKGSFVQRRVNRFLKDCRAKDWHHADDLSLAVIHLGGAECFPASPFRV